MTFLRRAAVAIAAVALVAGSAGGAGAAPLPMSSCTARVGVILAVDFGPWGGPVLRSCGSTPTTGFQLLNQGGWHSAGTQRDGPGFICRISYSGFRGGTAYPTPEQDACVVTPPATAYWSYWHADPGQNTWKYSTGGSASSHPQPGSIDMWTFGSQDKPSVTPSSLRNKPSAPPAPAPPASPSSKPTTASPPAPSATGSPSTSPSPPPSIVDAPQVADVPRDSGSAWPTVAAAGLIVLLAAAGILIARRRRIGG